MRDVATQGDEAKVATRKVQHERNAYSYRIAMTDDSRLLYALKVGTDARSPVDWPS